MTSVFPLCFATNTLPLLTTMLQGSGVCVDGCPAGDEVQLSSFFTNSRRSLLAVTEAQVG